MAEDMANGDEQQRTYHDAVQAAQGERITNMGRRINDVEVEMRAGFSQVNNLLNSSTNETRQAIAALSSNLAERNKTQWPVIFLAIGVASSVLGYFVTQALTPIRDANLDMKAAIVDTQKSIQALAANTVSRQEMDWRTQRGVEDRATMLASVSSIRDTMVYRNEWQERNLSRDHDIENIRADAVRDVANLQRQLDQQRADFQTFSNSLGNGRDLLIDLKTEQGRLRDQIAALMAKVAAEQAGTPR
jgi:DNA repair exonuclease SbcCD ATPase subunit